VSPLLDHLLQCAEGSDPGRGDDLGGFLRADDPALEFLRRELGEFSEDFLHDSGIMTQYQHDENRRNEVPLRWDDEEIEDE
jgi:hypothetical protein